MVVWPRMNLHVNSIQQSWKMEEYKYYFNFMKWPLNPTVLGEHVGQYPFYFASKALDFTQVISGLKLCLFLNSYLAVQVCLTQVALNC